MSPKQSLNGLSVSTSSYPAATAQEARTSASCKATSTCHSVNCVQSMHIKSSSIPFSKLNHDTFTANQGKGDQTGHTPAIIGADKVSVHTLEGYTALPQVILTSMCDTLLFINDIKLDGTKLTINVGIGRPGDNPQLVYNLVLIRV